MATPTTLITGATGFVGSALLDRLRREHAVRVLVRDADGLDDAEGIDVVEGDLDDDAVVRRALEGIGTAYYLVHSMEAASNGGFAQRDRELAEGFVAAAGRQGVTRIVYLGGIDPDGETSEHLESRQEVEQVLGGGRPELVALRASMIVGARSDSFLTLAQIVERLPVLALPTWRDAATQPIAVADVVGALAAAPGVPPGRYEIGGPDTVTVAEMIDVIGELAGRQPPSVDLPFSSSRLEGAVAALVTDADRAVLEPLFEGLHENLTLTENTLHSVFGIVPTPFRDAARDALAERAARAA